MNKFLFFAVPVAAIGLLFSCSSDTEPTEQKQAESSSSIVQGISSGGSSQDGSVLCYFRGGICAEIPAVLCFEHGQAVESCPETGNSSAQSGGSSSSLPSGPVFCEISGICTEVSGEVCSLLSGTTVQSCPISSSSAMPSSSSVGGSQGSSSSSSAQPSSSSVEGNQGSSSSSSVGGQGGGSSSSVEGNQGSSSSSSAGSSGSYGSLTYEGQTYKTVVIGTQTWMAENLNYAVEGSKCYNNLESNCDTYGRLYDWATAMGFASSCNSNSCSNQIQSKHRGICPNGWHIPNNDDWDKLFRYVDNVSGSGLYKSPTAGRYLKSTTGWNNNGNGTDQYGFSALPGGSSVSDGSFYNVGVFGDWWSASEYDSGSAYDRRMYYNGGDADWHNYFKSNMFSVRCLQDSPGQGSSSSSSAQPSSSSVALSSNSVVPSSSSVSPSSSSSSSYRDLCARFEDYYGKAFCDERDGNTYNHVKIGEQTWMKENLTYAASGSRCYIDQCGDRIFGRLYSWAAAMDLPSNCNSLSCASQIQATHKGVCPTGWHLPSNADWTELITYVEQNSGCSDCAGTKLKATKTWYDYYSRDTGTDDYGFQALPGGYYKSSDDHFYGGIPSGGSLGYWWSANEPYKNPDFYGNVMYMGATDYGGANVSDYEGWIKSNLVSVRCLRNE